MKKGAGEGWSCRFWLKACELFVYLNLCFRSYQFEEVLSSQTFITCRVLTNESERTELDAKELGLPSSS